MEEATESRRDRRSPEPRRRTAKVIAITSAAAVAAIGITGTLAAWNDTEWVHGALSAGGDEPAIGTSTFEVQQNTGTAGAWVDQETNPGGAIVFSAPASALTPGDTTYAEVALKTTAASVAGDVTLDPAVLATGITATDPNGLLFAALEVRVATATTAFSCDATAFDGTQTGLTAIAAGALSSTGGSASQHLDAAGGSTQYYCFEISLPSPLVPASGYAIDDYMGRSLSPAWKFDAVSD